MLLGLPINGKTVNGATNIDESITGQLMGCWLTQNDMRVEDIKVKWIKVLHVVYN